MHFPGNQTEQERDNPFLIVTFMNPTQESSKPHDFITLEYSKTLAELHKHHILRTRSLQRNKRNPEKEKNIYIKATTHFHIYMVFANCIENNVEKNERQTPKAEREIYRRASAAGALSDGWRIN